MELRQLRYFATLAEELHFGNAAAREHIVQSALSQQISRLERELQVSLFDRNTHQVKLTAAGEVFLREVRPILERVERAKVTVAASTAARPVLRVGVYDACFDSMPRLLRAVQRQNPELVIHRFEAGVPEQCRLLAEGRLDVGIGRASQAPQSVSSELLRLDPMGVLVGERHSFSELTAVPVARLEAECVVVGDETRSPEFSEFVKEMCRAAGFVPNLYPGTVQSVRGAADLVAEGIGVACVPKSCGVVSIDTRWVPLTSPVVLYPWSLLWRAGEKQAAAAVLRSARTASFSQGWLEVDTVAELVG